MKVAFRADASLQIGTGHVMRCLTLADTLIAQGVECRFICREHPGHLIELIRRKGHVCDVLPRPSETASLLDEQGPVHLSWLGVSQEEDAMACRAVLGDWQADWLVVDHYALDSRWELMLKPHYQRLLVIDDLADRPHACDLLLDQTFGRQPADYRTWVPVDSQLLCGSQYALLRPEFASLRPYSLQRRAEPQLRQLLITLGGVDKDNATGQVLNALSDCALPAGFQVTVVMGATAPWLSEVVLQAQQMPWPVHVLVGVSNMAQLMADSDFAIGAAGATTWERCCLGVPSILLVLADNQRQVARGMERVQAALIIDQPQEIASRLPGLLETLIEQPERLQSMSRAAADIVDGLGTETLVQLLEA